MAKPLLVPMEYQQDLEYTTELRRNLSGHSDTVWSVAISPSRTSLVVVRTDDQIWSLRTGNCCVPCLGIQAGLVRCHQPDGQTLASGSWDQTIKIWNLRTGKLLRSLWTAYVNTVPLVPMVKFASGSDDTAKSFGICWRAAEHPIWAFKQR